MSINNIPKDILKIMGERLSKASYQNGECIECDYKGSGGYSKIAVTKNKVEYKAMSHRISYLINKGQIPEGMHVCHKCDNPKCVNPDHLFVGTAKDNMDDMARKGRRPVGDNHPLKKVNQNMANEIRKLCKQGLKQHEVARRFDVAQSVVSNIVTNKIYLEEIKKECKHPQNEFIIFPSSAGKARCGVCGVNFVAEWKEVKP